MNRFKTWLTKKMVLIISVGKQIQTEAVIFRYVIKKLAVDQKDRFLTFINKSLFFNKTIYFIRLLSIKITSKISNILNKIPFINKILLSLRKKYFGFFSLALLVSLFIFYFMSLLISMEKNLTKTGRQDININFLLNAKLDELELRSRWRPKKPKQEEPPPETPKLKIQQKELQKPEMTSQLPQLDLPEDFQSDEKGASASAHDNQDRAATPIFRIQGAYPRQAALRNIEGFVILQFDITPEGSTDNITVIQASPPQIFNSSAIQALKKWKYKPKLKDGKPVRQKNLKVQLDFSLRDQ